MKLSIESAQPESESLLNPSRSVPEPHHVLTRASGRLTESESRSLNPSRSVPEPHHVPAVLR